MTIMMMVILMMMSDEMDGLHNSAKNGKQGKAHNVTLQQIRKFSA